MKNLRFTLGVCAATLVAFIVSETRASAQQGVYITQASARLSKLVDRGNEDGYKLHNNSFSVGGGWLKKSKEWVGIYTVELQAGKQYRFLASGDNDAKDVDLKIENADGKRVAIDDDTAADAIVGYSPKTSGRYTVYLRLYASREGADCVCLSVVMVK